MDIPEPYDLSSVPNPWPPPPRLPLSTPLPHTQTPLPFGAESWSEVIAHIKALTDQTCRSREYQCERNWYRTYHAIDTDEVLSTPEGRLGFHAGMLYARCQQECQT